MGLNSNLFAFFTVLKRTRAERKETFEESGWGFERVPLGVLKGDLENFCITKGIRIQIQI